jgi:hypothetical protein
MPMPKTSEMETIPSARLVLAKDMLDRAAISSPIDCLSFSDYRSANRNVAEP